MRILTVDSGMPSASAISRSPRSSRSRMATTRRYFSSRLSTTSVSSAAARARSSSAAGEAPVSTLFWM
jgi:hypothetical protein